MKRILTLTALALLAFTSMAWGQVTYYVDTTRAEIAGPDSLRIEAVRLQNGVPVRVALTFPVDEPWEVDGHRIVRLAVAFALDCAGHHMQARTVSLVDTKGAWGPPFPPPTNMLEAFRPEPGSDLDAVLRYACRQGADRRSRS